MNRKYSFFVIVFILTGFSVDNFAKSNFFVHSYQYTCFFLLLSVECSFGYFGEQCNGICGHCKDNSACHHFTGTCAKGCAPGYRFPKCTEGIYHTVFKKNTICYHVQNITYLAKMLQTKNLHVIKNDLYFPKI